VWRVNNREGEEDEGILMESLTFSLLPDFSLSVLAIDIIPLTIDAAEAHNRRMYASVTASQNPRHITVFVPKAETAVICDEIETGHIYQ
jgi:hypothetical protein